MPEYVENHVKEVNPQGLRGPLWTIAGAGIAALAAGALGNGGLGGLFGCNHQAAAMAGGAGLAVLAEKDAEIARLRAGERTDTKISDTYAQTLRDNKALRDELYAFISPIAQESAANRERVAVLEAQQKCDAEKAALREELLRKDVALAKAELRGEIATVANNADCCCKQLGNAIAGLQATVGGITKLIVPVAAICPQPAIENPQPTPAVA